MNKFMLLECTLRDGGYITNWKFDEECISEIIKELTESRFDFIEVGYLNNRAEGNDTTQFKNINKIKNYLPKNRKNSIYIAMADVQQFFPDDLAPFDGESIDGIRVVFYKHQIKEAIELGKAVKRNGYKLFMQPMVTIDYSMDEFIDLTNQILELNPFAVSIVDSFGYMLKEDFRKYFRILDNVLEDDVVIGFHSHNNMNLALINAQDILDYESNRSIVIDCSLCGMGRGAGNLHTELIANYYNHVLGVKYDMNKIFYLLDKYVLPIKNEKQWGYSPYYMATALQHCHPNYAAYLLQEYDISVPDFVKYLKCIPEEMYTKCKKEYVIKKYKEFSNFN